MVEFILIRCECSQARCELLANARSELRARFCDEGKTALRWIKLKLTLLREENREKLGLVALLAATRYLLTNNE